MTKMPKLARRALMANGMVWFGLAVFFAMLALERTAEAFAGRWYNVLGWALLVAVAVGLAVAGVIENHQLRARARRGR